KAPHRGRRAAGSWVSPRPYLLGAGGARPRRPQCAEPGDGGARYLLRMGAHPPSSIGGSSPQHGGPETESGQSLLELLAPVKPRLRGVLHEYAFFVSLGCGLALILGASNDRARV